MKSFKITLTLLLISTSLLRAEEGMWMPSILGKYTYKEMKKAGFKLSKKDIYDINNISLKDAILGLASSSNPTSFFGSASFISETGLVLTNHHLGMSYIQEYSTTENNFLKDGFLARSLHDELKANGLSLSRLVKIVDITKEITNGFEKLDGREQDKLLNERAKAIASRFDEGGKYTAKVKSYFSGNQYFIEVYEVFNQVKIVAIPPMDIAEFGGNQDNWQWPRQSAEFAVLRVYNELTNLPHKPVKHLNISTKGVKEGDFTMVYGFPGSTKLFLTSDAIDQLAKVSNYHAAKVRRAKIEIMEEAMNKSEALWLKYSDVHAKSSNHLLRWEAEMEGIENLGLVEQKKKFEKELAEKLKKKDRLAFDTTLAGIKQLVEKLEEYEKVNAYVMEAGIEGAELTSFIAMFDKLGALSTRYKHRVKQADLDKETRRLKHFAKKFFDNFDFETEKKILTELVKLYDQNLPDNYKTKAVKEGLAICNKNYTQYIDSVFSNSVFASQESISLFLDNFTKEDGPKLESDPAFQLCLGFYLVNRDKVYNQRAMLRNVYANYHKEYVRIISENADDKTFPDANRSLRISYGKVKGFTKDGKAYGHQTNLAGLLEKHNTGNRYYKLPEDFVRLVKESANPEKTAVCFINDTHTTGGNSGSAVLNAYGELIGLGFDRVNHGLVSDFQFHPSYSRNIAVDINYVIYILKNYMKSDELIKELSLGL